MKNYLLICILYFSNSLIAQEKKVQFGVQLFPNVSNAIESSTAYEEYYKGIGTYVFSYSGGLQFDWNFSEKWSLSSGLIFTKTGDKSNEFPPDPLRGFWFKRHYTFKLYYIEIPLLLNRNLSDHWGVEFGVSPMLNVVGKIIMTANEKDKYDFDLQEDNVNLFGLNTNLGVGYRTTVGNQSLKLFPYFQYNLLSGFNEISLADYLPKKNNISSGLKISYLF